MPARIAKKNHHLLTPGDQRTGNEELGAPWTAQICWQVGIWPISQ